MFLSEIKNLKFIVFCQLGKIVGSFDMLEFVIDDEGNIFSIEFKKK